MSAREQGDEDKRDRLVRANDHPSDVLADALSHVMNTLGGDRPIRDIGVLQTSPQSA